MWHARRDNARGAPTFRRVLWLIDVDYPACDCNSHTSTGIPCVHQLLILIQERCTLFDPRMFHKHWTRRTTVRCAPPSQEYIESSADSLPTSGPELCSSTPIVESGQENGGEQLPLSQGSADSYNLQNATPNSDMGSPEPNLAKPFDKVNTGKLISITKVLIDLVTRPAAKQKGLDQRFYDMLKTVRAQLVSSGGEDGNNAGINFNPLDQRTSRTLFQPDTNMPMEGLLETYNRGGAPQQLRKKKRHEPPSLKETIASRQFEVGSACSVVTEVASSKSRHPQQKDVVCRFCGNSGCTRRRCPKIRSFGSCFLTGQKFYNTVMQLLSTPVLFDTLQCLEEVPHGSILEVEPGWKTGKDFRHIVLKAWVRSTMSGNADRLFVCIRCVKKNLQWLDTEEMGVVVDAQQLYNEYVKHKLAKKSLSKLIVVQGLYICST